MRFAKCGHKAWQVTEGGETFYVSDKELSSFAYHGYFIDKQFDPSFSYRFILSCEEKEESKVEILAVTETVALNDRGIPHIIGEGSVLARFKDGSISIFTREEEERLFERGAGFDPRRSKKLTASFAAEKDADMPGALLRLTFSPKTEAEGIRGC